MDETKQIAAMIPEEKHNALKALLAARGETITEWLVRLVERELQKAKA